MASASIIKKCFFHTVLGTLYLPFWYCHTSESACLPAAILFCADKKVSKKAAQEKLRFS